MSGSSESERIGAAQDFETVPPQLKWIERMVELNGKELRRWILGHVCAQVFIIITAALSTLMFALYQPDREWMRVVGILSTTLTNVAVTASNVFRVRDNIATCIHVREELKYVANEMHMEFRNKASRKGELSSIEEYRLVHVYVLRFNRILARKSERWMAVGHGSDIAHPAGPPPGDTHHPQDGS